MKMRLKPIIFLFTAVTICVWWTAAEGRRNDNHHNLIKRLETLEDQQRDSLARIEVLKRTVISQKRTIEQQSRDIKAFHFIVHKYRTREQRANHRFRVQGRQLSELKKALMAVGLIKNNSRSGERHETSAQEMEQTLHQVDSKDQRHETSRIRHQEDSKVQRHETKHRAQSRISKRRPQTFKSFPMKRQGRTSVAFSAYLDHSVDLGTHQTIKFNQIITNEGNGYSQHTGVFKCPEAGVYMFSFFIGQRDVSVPRGIAADLMVNSKNVLGTTVEALNPGQDITGGNVAVLRLQQGDVVWVDSVFSNGHAEGSTAFKLTSFSGVLLYQ